jgi:hypothetical protein
LGSKKIGLEVNADKYKYMVMSGNQNAKRNPVERLRLEPLNWWKIGNILEQTYQLKSLFMEKLRSD